MNTFVQQYSTTSALDQLKKAQRIADEEEAEFSELTWGSMAGFGHIAKGSPAFMVPNLPDVRE